MHSIGAHGGFSLSLMSIKHTNPGRRHPPTHPTAAALIVIAARAYLMFYGLSILLPFGVPLWTRTPGKCAVVLNCTEHVCVYVCVCVCASMIPAARFIRFSSKSSSSCARPSTEPISQSSAEGHASGKYVHTYIHSVMMPLYNGCGWCAPGVRRRRGPGIMLLSQIYVRECIKD